MIGTRGFDTKCLRLAEDFSSDWGLSYSSPEGLRTKLSLCTELAQRIQDTIEEFEEEMGVNK